MQGDFLRMLLVVVFALGLLFGIAWMGSEWTRQENVHAQTSPAGFNDVGSANILGTRLIDVEGNFYLLGLENDLALVALTFVDPECETAVMQSQQLNMLAQQAASQGVEFYGVVSDPHRTRQDVENFRQTQGFHFPLLLDASGDLAYRLNPSVVPQAFLIDAQDEITFSGRINRLGDAIANPKGFFSSSENDLVGCAFDAWPEVSELDISYARDIAPIINANCIECHQVGGIAPFSLRTFEDVQRFAPLLARVTSQGIMPPFRADADANAFRNERSLSNRQIEIIGAWADDGAPAGNLDELIAAPDFSTDGWRLGQPDLIITMTEPFNVPANGDDIYRYFIVPDAILGEASLVAIDFKPGDPSVVHHANLFIDYEGRGRQLDAMDPEPGFSVFGTGNFMDYDGAGAIGGYVPGQDPYQMPEGLAIPIFGKGDGVFEIHYHPNGTATQDQSQMAFYFEDDQNIIDYVDGLVIGTQEIDIPAYDSDYWRHFFMEVPAGFSLIDILPHMHLIGAEARVFVTYPDGTQEPLVCVGNWDLNWQNIYSYRQSVHIPAGSRIDSYFRYDNPSNNNVGWGWQTTDEMAEVWLTIQLDDPGSSDALHQASDQAWLRFADPRGSIPECG